MKQADVKVGGTYLTRVSCALVEVTVIQERHEVTRNRWGDERKRTVYLVRRVGGGILPKCRTPAALRERPVKVSPPIDAELRRARFLRAIGQVYDRANLTVAAWQAYQASQDAFAAMGLGPASQPDPSYPF